MPNISPHNDEKQKKRREALIDSSEYTLNDVWQQVNNGMWNDTRNSSRTSTTGNDSEFEIRQFYRHFVDNFFLMISEYIWWSLMYDDEVFQRTNYDVKWSAIAHKS